MRTPCEQHKLEDDDDIRETLAELLQLEGYRVKTANNGQAALSILAHRSPCIMLLDLMMPVMSGWEVAAEMSARPNIAVPYCVVSATVEAAPAASTCVLRKPIDCDKLLRIVASHCGKPTAS